MPMASMAEDMVLAVYMPPHEPAPGTGVALDLEQLLVVDLPGRVLAHGLEDAHDGQVAARRSGPA